MQLKADYPLTEICQVLDYARSSAYYQSQQTADVQLREAIQRLAGDYPTYGYRRITAMLKREDWSINHKRIQRLMKEMGLTARQKRRKKRTTNSNHGYPSTNPNGSSKSASKSAMRIRGQRYSINRASAKFALAVPMLKLF